MGMRDDAGFLLLLSIPGWGEIDVHRVDHVIDLEPELALFPRRQIGANQQPHVRSKGKPRRKQEKQGGMEEVGGQTDDNGDVETVAEVMRVPILVQK